MHQLFTYKPEVMANERRSADFKVGVRLFYMVTIVWIVQKSLYLEAIFHRKETFSKPLHWFGHILFLIDMPQIAYQILGMLGILICIYSLVTSRNKVGFQICLLLILMMLNTLKLSLGYLEHVDHLFLLAHFFLISYQRNKINALYVKYFQLGLLFTYSLSGLLKLVILGYKFAFTTEITWMHPKAMYYQTYILFGEMHQSMPVWMERFLTMGPLPTMLIIAGLVIETLAAFFVFRYRLLRYYLLWLLVFHMLNYLFFNINFVYAGLTAVCFLFPYSTYVNKIRC